MNTQPKHTPGPWVADVYGVVTGGSNGLTSICETYAHTWVRSKANLPTDKDETAAWLDNLHSEAMANARLIASAPDMFELLTDIGRWLETGLARGSISCGTANRDGDLVSQIRAALNKATGGK
jgi:hypothetical protein